VKRILSVVTLLSMLCSITAANAGVQVLCSHDDGFGHVVSHDTHEKESHASCDHHDSPEKRSSQELTHEDANCEDVEWDDSELEDLSSSNDRSNAKAPTLQFSANAFSSCQIEVSLKEASKPPAYKVLQENQSRRFAKIVQIRC